MAKLKIRVDSPKVRYSEDFIEAEYEYRTTRVAENDRDENDRDTYTVGQVFRSSFHPSIHPSMLRLVASSVPPRHHCHKCSSRLIDIGCFPATYTDDNV